MFLFIESNTTGTGERFLNAAIETGEAVTFAAKNATQYPFIWRLPIDIVEIDTTDPHAIERAVKHAGQPTAVFSNADQFLEVAAIYAERHGLFGQPVAAIRLVQDKLAMFDALSAQRVPVPDTVAVESVDDCQTAARRLGCPCVVKPRRGSGSVGVRLCRSPEEVISHFNTLSGQDAFGRGVLVQEFISGSEHSVECVGVGNAIAHVAVVDKHLGEPPDFVEIGHDCPTQLDRNAAADLCGLVQGLLQKLGLSFGATHTEVRMRDGKPFVIEINPRPAGGMIPLLLEVCYGVPFFQELIRLQLGRAVDLEPTCRRAGSIRFVLPSTPGDIVGLTGLREARGAPGVREVGLHRLIGGPATLRGDFSDRIAHVVASGLTLPQAIYRAETAVQKILVTVQPSGNDVFKVRPSVLQMLQREDSDIRDELRRQTDIDKAHIIMLKEAGLLSYGEATILLCTVQKLIDENFHPVVDLPMPRGTYLAYESWLVSEAGAEAGGRLHMARSRNDINATANRLLLREVIATTFSELLRLRRSLLRAAARHSRTAFPVHSQFLPAMPSTACHYLLAIEDVIASHCDAIFANLALITSSPMGAVAGAGTSIPIRPTRTAYLLGFETAAANSLSAVADRSHVLAVLGTLTSIGVTLSRVAQDIHVWATQEPRLVTVPNDLTSGSSAMPQKRNPYLLEWLKATASHPAAAFISATMSMVKAPFSNSYEVSGVAMEGLHGAGQDTRQMIAIACEILSAIEFQEFEAKQRLRSSYAFSTLVLERMVMRLKMTPRAAHERLSRMIHLSDEDLDADSRKLWDEVSDIADHSCLARELRHGGGPGDDDAAAMAQLRMSRHLVQMQAVMVTWATARIARDGTTRSICDAERRGSLPENHR